MYSRGQIYREGYTYYANKLTTLLNKVRKVFYYKLFSRCLNNSAKTWFHVNKLIGNCPKITMSELIVNGNVLPGVDMADYANRYFTNAANNLTENLIDVPFRFYNEPNPHTFLLQPTDAYEAVKVIMGLKNEGNCIIDLSIKSVKNNAHILSVHVALLYNYSIEKCTYPDLLKIATVIPGYEAGSRDLIDNYRPISNLPLFSKTFDKLAHIRVISFIELCNLLNDAQFGFQKGKSITHAVLKLTSMIVGAYHSKQFCACFFLDLCKAFNTLDHKILLKKLDCLGFCGHSNEYLRSYIANRRQSVQIGCYSSNESLISKGVPQGSILGPMLFCL